MSDFFKRAARSGLLGTRRKFLQELEDRKNQDTGNQRSNGSHTYDNRDPDDEANKSIASHIKRKRRSHER